MNDEKIYGVIAESKLEQPLVMERPLMTLDEAYECMCKLAERPEVIRVAMFKAVHARGHETLIPKEPQP